MAAPADAVATGAPRRIQRSAQPTTGYAEPAPASVDHVLSSHGTALPAELREEMEQRFGHDFSCVRVHAGGTAERSARDVHAHAYTAGRDIVFGAGRYQPGTPVGRRLIAHELTHVVQQSDSDLTAPTHLRRTPEDGADTAPAVETSERLPEGPPPEQMAATGPGLAQSVDRIVMACGDMALRLETASTAYRYRLQTCSLPLGSFQAQVTVTENDFHLDFGGSVGGDQEFEFSYVVEPGQTNPAVLLRRQATVPVDVVDRLGPVPAPRDQEESRQQPECFRLPDRELVPAASRTLPLFPAKTFNHQIWSEPIPLGSFGWIDLTATATGGLTGNLSGRYGPGMLTDICLTRTIDRTSPGPAPINHPLLRAGSQANVDTYHIGGRARFRLPASAALRLSANGNLSITGEYLSMLDVAQFNAGISADGQASAAGEINATVNVIAEATHATATLEPVIGPLSVVQIENSSIDKVDLTAEVGLNARAALRFSVNAGAGLTVAGVDLWRQDWKLIDFNAPVAWSGGLRYSPNPGAHWDLGTLQAGDDVDDEVDAGEPPHYETANVDEDDVVEAILDENRALVTAPDGLSEATALPFEWRKPIRLYPATIAIPNADDPQELSRDAGPTTVRYQENGRTLYEEIGVADWPAARRTFQFMPYDSRSDPEKARFNRVMDRLGASRAGTDADHVWDLFLRGAEFDRFDNLWPASNLAQQLAGGRHATQIRNYRATIPNLNGRWFVITRIRDPE